MRGGGGGARGGGGGGGGPRCCVLKVSADSGIDRVHSALGSCHRLSDGGTRAARWLALVVELPAASHDPYDREGKGRGGKLLPCLPV